MSMKKVFTLLAVLLIYALPSFAQDTAKAFYFPHKTGDMWEYLVYEFGFIIC